MEYTLFGTKLRKGQKIKLSSGEETVEMRFNGINSLNELQISIRAPQTTKIEKIKTPSKKVRSL